MTVSTVLGKGFSYAVALLILCWEVLALHYDLPYAARDLVAAVLAVLSLLLAFFRPGVLAILVHSGIFLLVLVWWLSIKPSHERPWARDVAVMPYADIAGDLVAIHNIRNIKYRSETDFEVRYYETTVRLSQLDSLDLFISSWGARLIAHPILSFGFEDGRHIAVSVETRKQQHQRYSALAGFFRQYGLIYVVADERDVIRLRSNYRQEEVHLYRLPTSRAKAKQVFLYYMQRINSLKEQPEFYNALVDNCTTNIYLSLQVEPPYPPLSLGIILPGYLDRDIYKVLKKQQGLDISFEQFQRKSRINAAAQAAPEDADFSRLIREEVP